MRAEISQKYNFMYIYIYVHIQNHHHQVVQLRDIQQFDQSAIKRALMNFRRILSTVRLFRDFIQPPGYINWKKEGGKKDIRDCPRTDRTAVPANFPNFANKSSDVKIPRWIVKVLTSSAILQSPSYLHFSCTRVPFRATIVKRETKTKTRLTGDWGARWRKSTRACIIYLPRVAATASGRETRRSSKSSRK